MSGRRTIFSLSSRAAPPVRDDVIDFETSVQYNKDSKKKDGRYDTRIQKFEGN